MHRRPLINIRRCDMAASILQRLDYILSGDRLYGNVLLPRRVSFGGETPCRFGGANFPMGNGDQEAMIQLVNSGG